MVRGEGRGAHPWLTCAWLMMVRGGGRGAGQGGEGGGPQASNIVGLTEPRLSPG